MNFDVEFEQEEDGRWIAEIPEIPGVLAYGETPMQAGAKARALALRVLAERMENEVSFPGINSIAFVDRLYSTEPQYGEGSPLDEPVAVN